MTEQSPLKQRLLDYEEPNAALKAKVAPLRKLVARSIGCPREVWPNENRVALTPETASVFNKMGITVKIEEAAGKAASFSEQAYSDSGALVVGCEEVWACDMVLKVRAPTSAEWKYLRKGLILVSFIWPAQNQELYHRLADQGCTVFAMDQVPRISRAQVFDALSSMANIAGYKAIIEASHHFGRFLGGQMTAAGSIPPAKVLIIGAGVAGLSAIATAKKMGAIVRCFDTRPVCREQVESLGGEFLELQGFELAEGTGGYAKIMSEEFLEAEKDLFMSQAAEVDIIITTALIPGRPAPKLITADMVKLMKPGSVLIDLAAEQGGNIETTVKDQVVLLPDNQVLCVGYTDFPSRLASQSSRLYSQNVAKLIQSFQSKDRRCLSLDFSDLVVRCTCICHAHDKLYPPPSHIFPAPPPPPKVAPKRDGNTTKPTKEMLEATEWQRAKFLSLMLGILLCTMIALNMLSHDPNLLTMIVVFTLAGTAGYQAVWGVTPALHTPLMSVTNAISGVTALGGMLLISAASASSGPRAHKPQQYFADAILGEYAGTVSLCLGGLATVASCVNILGGFTVTARMLDMFKRPGDPEEHNMLYAIPALVSSTLYLWFRFGLGVDTSELCYLAASLCCIFAIAALAKQQTARFGNAMGMIGVALGVVCTTGLMVLDFKVSSIMLIIIAAGACIGFFLGNSVQVTELPQTVAAFHSLVGFAAMLTSVGHYIIDPPRTVDGVKSNFTITIALSSILGTFIGGITLTGSLVAFAKLHGLIRSKPLSLPLKNYINGGLLIYQIMMIAYFVSPAVNATMGLYTLLGTTITSLVLGWHTVSSIGGGDMPVCITVLNSYSGWALVAEGFMLDNLMLTIVGSLIGFSGGILSYIMCVAMNRSLGNVLFGGYANKVAVSRAAGMEKKEHKETTVEEVVELLVHSKSVIIVPGYGMAVAKAQYAVADLASTLRSRNISVRFAIHPVAGRMPGQMNVLLAEAGLPYDWVFEMDEINSDFPETDVALVIGANDITNSAAEEDPTCSIAGMPVLQAWKAKTCVYMKRTMGSGYADLENPVFYKPNTLMLLGDAKTTTESYVTKIKQYFNV